MHLPTPEEYAKAAAKYRSEGHPAYAAVSDLEGYVASFYKTAGDVLSSLTSPGQLTLMALTAGGSELEQAGYQILARLARVPGKAVGLWFGAQGLKMAATPQQPGENQYDAFWRRNLGLSAFLGTAHDTWSSSKAGFQNFLKKQFKLSDDLAGKVTSQVARIDEARKQRASSVQGINIQTDEDVRALQESLQKQVKDIQATSFVRMTGIRAQAEQAIEQAKGQLNDLQKQRLRKGAETVADTMQAFLQEKARVSKPFDDIAAKIKGTVAQKADVRGVIQKAFKDTGVDDTQIPPRVFELLKSGEAQLHEGNVMLRTPDGHYMEVDQKYAPTFLDKGYELASSGVSTGEGIPFDQLTRVREDVGQAANASKDTRVRAALFKAHDELTDFQEKIAQKHGQGPAYKIAKDNYKTFKRGIGTDMVETFLDASTAEDQALAPKIAEMTTRENAEALRTVFKAAGVDTKPLDSVIQEIKLVDEQIAETQRLAGTMVSETRGSATRAAAGLKAETREEIAAKRKGASEQKKEAEKAAERKIAEVKKEPVVPGQDVETLQGKPNRELLEARMRQQMNTAHGGGFVNTWAMTSIIFGLMETVRGSYYGPLLVTKGYLLMKLPSLMKETKFQDWVIRQSGMEPGTPQAARMRKGIEAMGPILRKALKTGIPQAAAVKAGEQLSVPDMPQ
jgi:hypothetical protein